MTSPRSTSFWLTSLLTSPITSHSFLATSQLRNLIGISWTCTHNETLSKTKSLTCMLWSYRWIITKCLSKLYGSPLKIFSTSSSLSNTNNNMWFPTLRTLNPFFELQMGLKVLIVASVFNAHLVRNFAAIVQYDKSVSSTNWNSPPSLSFKDTFSQHFVTISIIIQKKKFQQHSVIPTTPKKIPNKPRSNNVTWGTQKPYTIENS